MDLLIGDIFRNAARAVPGRIAAVVGDREMTFAQVEARSNQVARALIACGVGYGDRVVVWSGTSLDVVPLFAAVSKLGVVFAPASPLLGADEGADMIGSARPSLIAADPDRLPMAVEIGKALGVPALGTDGLARPGGGGDLLAQAADEQPDSELPSPAALHEGDPHVIFFTSGSTGRPKGVILSHRVNMLRTYPGSQLEPRGALVSPYPLFHMGAWTLALQQWQARDTVVLSGADAAGICDAITRYRATRINAIPGVWRRVLDCVEHGGGSLETLRFADTGTSATPPELLSAIATAAPRANVRVFYGATESGNVASLGHDDIARKPGSCGTPASLAEVRLDDAGELWVRSPVLFDGYFENEEATSEVLVDGWYRSGDVVEVDSEGYLTVVGRARDVIRTGGETVAPAEVEHVLADEPSVADVAVVGIPDATWGEIVCAVVVVRAGHHAPDVEQLRAHCAGRLAGFKQPRRVEVAETIPRTASTSQVQRRLLVERLISGA
jgi:acyl-CoA synthetase (AMP-forming)/AMP-acid ligase II